MKQEPCAFVPTKEAARELRKIARELRLFVEATPQPILPDGTRTVSTFPPDQTDSFPVSVDLNEQTMTIPDLFVDFFDWFYLPSRTIEDMPVTGTHWLRMVINATYDMTKAVGAEPPEAVVNTPTFNWIADDPSPDYTNPFPPVSTSTDYFFYLVQVTGGIVTATRDSRFVWGGPGEVPAPP